MNDGKEGRELGGIPRLDELWRAIPRLPMPKGAELARLLDEIKLLAQAIKSISECVSITDSENKILFVNEAFLRTYGYQENELIGRSIEIVRSPKNPQPLGAEVLSATLAGGWQGELINRRKDGSEFPIHLSTSLVRDDAGNPLALIGVATDVTDRKRGEAALRESEERYRRLVEYAPDVIFTLKPAPAGAPVITSLNPAFEKTTGWSREEWIGRPIADILHPDDLQAAVAIFRQALAGETPPIVELRVLSKARDYLIGEFTGTPYVINGQTAGSIGIARDITERKRAEEALRASEERFRALYDDIPAMYLILARDGTVLSVNRFGANHLGYSSDELVGRSVACVVHPDDWELVKRQLACCMGQPGQVSHLEFRKLRKDGGMLWVREVACAASRGPGEAAVLLIVCEDVTERKRSQELYRHLLDTIPSSVLLIDQQRRVVLANRTFLEQNQRCEAETFGRGIHEIFPQMLMKEMGIEDRIHQVFQTHHPAPAEKMAFCAPGAPPRIYSYTIVPVMWGGEAENVMLLMDDVTEQTRLGEEARRTERQLASIVESANELVLSTDTEGRIMTVNPAFAGASGLAPAELVGRLFCALAIEEHQAVAADTLRQVKDSANAVHVEWDILTRTGPAVPVSWACSPMKDDAGRPVGVVAVGRDLTERRKLEAQLIQSEKLAALGILAGGIAHELRNPLAIASSAAQLIMENPRCPGKVKLCAEKIHNAITRASLIIESLLRFARPSSPGAHQAIALGSLVRDTLAVVASQAKVSRVTVETSVAPLPLIVKGDPNLLQQMLINLFLNAFNAMPGGGLLQVSLAHQDDQVILAVTDSGRGIAAADLGRIFDPFYTTMPVGKGTGLGLSLCYSIVKQHGGVIEVTSVVGRGSTFTIRLPLLTR